MKSQSIGSVIFHQLLIPVAIALFMAFICQPLYLVDGTCNYTLLWLLIGIPFGIRKMVLWILPGKHDLGTTIGLLVLCVLIGGFIGIFVFLSRIVAGIISTAVLVYRNIIVKK